MFLAPAGRSELVVPAVRADFTLQVRAVRAGVAHGVTSEYILSINSLEREVLRYIQYIPNKKTKYIRYNFLILKVFTTIRYIFRKYIRYILTILKLFSIYPIYFSKQKHKYIRYNLIIPKVLTTIEYIFPQK